MRFLAILPLVVASLVPTAAEGASTATMRQLAGPIPNPLVQPVGLVKVGNVLFVLDKNAIDRVDLTTFGFSVFVGERHISGSADGMGNAARFNFPYGVAVAGDGNLYVTDLGNHTVRKIVPATRTVTTLAGSAGMAGTVDGPARPRGSSSPRPSRLT